MNFKHNAVQNHAPDDVSVSAANDAGYFHPITIATGKRVQTAKGTTVHQPFHDIEEHHTFHSLEDVAAALIAHDVKLPAEITPEALKDVKKRVPYWVLGGLKNGGSPRTLTGKDSKNPENDIYRRTSGNIGACPLLAFDIDGCSRAIFERLTGGEAAEFGTGTGLLEEYAAVMYQSPSHTAAAPRFRMLIQCDELIQPEDKGRVSRQVERHLMQQIGAGPLPPVMGEDGKVIPRPGEYQLNGEVIKFDSRVYLDNQVIYLPPADGLVLEYTGQLVNVASLPALAPEEQAAARSVSKPVDGIAPDKMSEAAQWLLDEGLAEHHDGKTLNILCAWHEDHTDGGGVINNGTVFKMDADSRAERFHCSHNSCKHRLEGEPGVMLAYALALGMPQDIAQKAWGSVAHVDEFDIIEAEGGELIAAGSVTPNPNLYKMADSELATLIARHLPGTALDLESGEFYRYQADPKTPAFGTWQPWNENRLAGFTASTFDLYGSPYQVAKINSVVKAVRIKAQRLQPQAAAAVIPFANGVFNLQNATFGEHRPDNWLLSTNGITWSEAAEGENLGQHAPNFAHWLDFVSEGNAAKVLSIKALFYAVLTNRYQWQKFYELTGPGGSGKGTAMQLCELLAGADSSVSIDAESLDDARKREPVAQAKLITLPDQKQYTGDGNGLRAITGGDSVSIDPKHKKPYSAVIRAVIVAANNSPMIFTERAGGIERRRIIFHFGRVVPEAQRDRALMDKIADELPVVIRDLLATFPNGKGAEAAIIAQKESAEAVQVKADTDPLTHFASMLNFGKAPEGLALGIAQARKFNADESGFAAELFAIYPCYQRYCEANGVQTLSLNKFRHGMKQAAAVHGATFITGERRSIKGKPAKETPTNVISYKPELMEYVPTCLDVGEDLSV